MSPSFVVLPHVRKLNYDPLTDFVPICNILIVSGALDILTQPETGAALAALYGATYQLEPEHGHNVLLGKGARRIAEDVIAWVVGRVQRSGKPPRDAI